MSSMKLVKAVLVFALALTPIGGANPTAQFPINSQVPLVAQSSQPYNFTFSESTFISSTGPITYILSNAPAWLKLDSGSRTFSGLPAQADIGSATFQLIASDAQGSTAMSSTFVVVQNTTLEVGQPLSTQLATFGAFSSPASLLLHPLQAIAFELAANTFVQTSSNTAYYAILEDNSPLPSWLLFDASKFGFSGTSPPLVSPSALPQSYGVKLIASDVQGFAEVMDVFQIVVGYNVLAFSVSDQTINATRGQYITTTPLRTALSLNGKTIQDAEVSSVACDAPDWLELDTANISLEGTAPADAATLSVLISVRDIYGDAANSTINIEFTQNSSKLLLGSPPPANATTGMEFEYTINRSLFSSADVTLRADLGSASTWLTFDPNNLTLEGHVPQNLTPGPINIALFAMAENVTDTTNLRLNIVRLIFTTTFLRASASSTSSIASASGVPTPSTFVASGGHMAMSEHTLIKIVLAVVLPILFLLSLLAIICFCLRRRTSIASSTVEAHEPLPTAVVEEPIEGDANNDAITAPTGVTDAESYIKQSDPPRIELSWASDSLRIAKARLSRRLSNQQDSFMDLRWKSNAGEDRQDALPEPEIEGAFSHECTRTSNDLAPFVSTRRPGHVRDRIYLRPIKPHHEENVSANRASKALSGLSTISYGLPDRLSGAGHGAGGVSSPGFVDLCNSWKDTESSLRSTDGGISTADIVDAFPQPPVEAPTMGGNVRSPTENRRPTLMVDPVSSGKIHSQVEQRQRWHTERARNRLERGPCFSSIGGLERSEATNFRPSPLRPSRRPVSRLKRDLSTANSGQFDSPLSTSSSIWEDERLPEEREAEEKENRFAAASPPEGAYIRESVGRNLRLREVPGSRPVSVGEANLHRTERSQAGSLAFI